MGSKIIKKSSKGTVMLGRTLIISGGVIDIQFAKEYLEGNVFDTVVCADSGLDSACRLGLPVHYAMGDFDSVSPEVKERYQAEGMTDGVHTEFVAYPPEKDATDTHIVLDWVTEQLPEEIVILGATGKRLDHFLANLNILLKPLSYGIPAYIIDRYNKLYMLDHSVVIQRKELFGKYISLLPFTKEVTGVCLRGFRYGLENRTLVFGDSIGVSNEMGEGEDAALIKFEEGILIVAESRD